MNGPKTTEETYHISNILKHYAHAREKHPYFCDRTTPDWVQYNIKDLVRRSLEGRRAWVKDRTEDGSLRWNDLLDCEVWEAIQAIVNGDTAHAIEELYDCIAVCLRTVDVLEGRQKLGKPETKGEAK